MPNFAQEDWNMFCDNLIKGGDAREAIKWISARDGADQECQHERTREIATVTTGKKVFCVKCDLQLQ